MKKHEICGFIKVHDQHDLDVSMCVVRKEKERYGIGKICFVGIWKNKK